MIEEVMEITLVKKALDTNNPITEKGEPNILQTENTVYARNVSIRQSEYYSASDKGFQPDFCFEINGFEYNGERFCLIDNITYEIYRTYQKQNGEIMELYLRSKLR